MENLTVSAIFDAYLADRRNPFSDRKCKHPDSIAFHLVAARKEWGNMPVVDFKLGSKARIKAKVQEWRAANIAQATCRKRVQFVKTAFRFAVEEEIIPREDEPVIKLPANGPPRERFVDQERELPALLRAADKIKTPDHIRLQAELSIRTGQRRGAILALRWSQHIDFERRIIRFRDTEEIADRSKKRRTDQPMDQELFDLLVAAKERADCDYVIEWRGRPVKSTYSGMKALYKRAGIENLHIHDLRRTAATYVNRELGGDIGAAAGFIGDTEKVAAKHYVQDDAGTRLPQMHALARVMARARSTSDAASPVIEQSLQQGGAALPFLEQAVSQRELGGSEADEHGGSAFLEASIGGNAGG